MIKFTQNNDYDFAIESVIILNDEHQLTKRASARALLKFCKTANQTDLHVIALGAYEGTGFNRNLDAFTEKDCIRNHHYFTDANRAVHRHHKNKKNDPKYGNIKAAAYNYPMKRIELIIGLDNDKCQDILEEQEKTGNTNWSMASRQDHDVCTWCGHKAKTDKDRCECIPKHLGELNKHGQMCGMMNPDPKWFELSHVRRQADRIGVSLKKMAGYDQLKPMSTNDYLLLYPGFEIPQEDIIISKKASDKRSLLDKLAAMEKHMQATSKGRVFKQEPVAANTMDELRKHDPAKVLKILADHGIVFSPEDFAKYLFDKRVSSKNVAGMKTHLPDIFSDLSGDNDGEVVNNEKYEPGTSSVLPPEIKKMISQLSEGNSLFDGPTARRMVRITIMCGRPEREAKAPKTKEAFDRSLAEQYAAYKLAALNYLHENNRLDQDTMINAVLQNLA